MDWRTGTDPIERFPTRRHRRLGGVVRRALAVATLALLGAASAANAQASADGDREEVLAVVQGLLDAMAERDSAAARDLLAPDARFLRIVVDGDTAGRQWRDADAFLRQIGGEGPRLRETIHDPQVTVDAPHATVRARYDFRVDGDFSHCGTNHFHLTRTTLGWVLAAVAYTVRDDPSACPGEPSEAGRHGSGGHDDARAASSPSIRTGAPP